jgi:hypothetical protein
MSERATITSFFKILTKQEKEEERQLAVAEWKADRSQLAAQKEAIEAQEVVNEADIKQECDRICQQKHRDRT